MTGDNHIGLKYASHEKASELIKARIDAFCDMVDTANRESCDLFVITGDLFENNYSVLKKDITNIADILSKFNGTVIVLPGNHDYYDPEAKTWQHFMSAVAAKDNILVLTDYKPYDINANGEAVVLYPALCKSLHSESGKNNLGWIKTENIIPDSTYRIGIAHGAIEGATIDNEGKYFLMKESELESIPVDAWLIGHTHVPIPNNLTEHFSNAGKIFNAGTHVQTDVNCNTEGLCFIIEINSDKTVKAKKFISGGIRFYRKNITLNANQMESDLSRALDEIGDNSVVDIVVSGAVTGDEYETRRGIIEAKLARFIESSYSDSALSKLISEELINAEFPETSFSADFLSALIENPKEAQLAYELLKSLKEGK